MDVKREFLEELAEYIRKRAHLSRLPYLMDLDTRLQDLIQQQQEEKTHDE